MNGFELDAAMRRDPVTAHHYIGTYAADTLPRFPPYPALLIVNTMKSYSPGEHWVAIALDAHGRGEYFDSYGRGPVVREHRDFMARSCSRWRYNETWLQSLDSSVCGQHCVMYLVHRAHGITLDNYVQSYFSKNTQKNDEIVSILFQHYIEKMPVCEGVSFSCNNQICFPRKK